MCVVFALEYSLCDYLQRFLINNETLKIKYRKKMPPGTEANFSRLRSHIFFLLRSCLLTFPILDLHFLSLQQLFTEGLLEIRLNIWDTVINTTRPLSLVCSKKQFQSRVSMLSQSGGARGTQLL